MVVKSIRPAREIFWLEDLRIKAGLTREQLRDRVRDYCEAEKIEPVPGLSTINNWMTRTTRIGDEWQRRLLKILNEGLPKEDQVNLPELYVERAAGAPKRIPDSERAAGASPSQRDRAVTYDPRLADAA